LEKEWYSNGQLKKHAKTENGIETFREGYKEDGSKDDVTIAAEKRQKAKNEARQIALEEYKKELSKANSLFEQKSLEKAYSSFDKVLGIGENLVQSSKPDKDTSGVEYLKANNKKISEKLREIDPVKYQEYWEVPEKYSTFRQLYYEGGKVGGHNDDPNDPAYDPNYKFVFKTGEKAYENYKYSAGKTKELGDETLKLLNKLISLAPIDNKEINRQLKEAKTTAEIKQILGL
jgi:hypothetical protein